MEIGTTIIYGSQVCKVTDKAPRTFGKITREYYVLTPAYDERNVIYVPADNEQLTAKMKKILSAEEIYALIRELPSADVAWIEDDKERATAYKNILEGGDRREIMLVIKALYERNKQLVAMGRRLHTADEQIFTRAEKVIYEEFALVLDIKKEEVAPFIIEQIKVKEKQ